MIRTEIHKAGPATIRVRRDREDSTMSEITRHIYKTATILEAGEASVCDDAAAAADQRVREAIEGLLLNKYEESQRLVDQYGLTESAFDIAFEHISRFVDGVEAVAEALQLEIDKQGW